MGLSRVLLMHRHRSEDPHWSQRNLLNGYLSFYPLKQFFEVVCLRIIKILHVGLNYAKYCNFWCYLAYNSFRQRFWVIFFAPRVGSNTKLKLCGIQAVEKHFFCIRLVCNVYGPQCMECVVQYTEN